MKRGQFICLLFFMLCCTPVVWAEKLESQYRDAWCAEQGGTAEVTLSDRTRCDCVTATHAVEVESARKWKEAIGQALHYALMTGKLPGIVLILGPGDDRYAEMLERVIDKYALPIKVWETKS